MISTCENKVVNITLFKIFNLAKKHCIYKYPNSKRLLLHFHSQWIQMLRRFNVDNKRSEAKLLPLNQLVKLHKLSTHYTTKTLIQWSTLSTMSHKRTAEVYPTTSQAP